MHQNSQPYIQYVELFRAFLGADHRNHGAMSPVSIITRLPRLVVDLEMPQVRYEGTAYHLTRLGALLLHALVEAKGEWVAISRLPEISKPSAVKSGLPEPIQTLIETSRGKGYRLNQI